MIADKIQPDYHKLNIVTEIIVLYKILIALNIHIC